MQYFVLFLVFIVVSVNVDLIKCSDPETCRACKLHQVLNECASPCIPEATCEEPNPTASEPCITVCVRRCQCDAKAGYIRQDKDGKCIKKEDCPGHCNADEILNPCATCTPEPTCQNREPVEFPCRIKCSLRCECDPKQGLIRDESTGKCVESCPRCGSKEREGCAPCCPDPTCQDPTVYPCPGPCLKICRLTCLCIEGYLRDTVSGKCVPEKICHE